MEIPKELETYKPVWERISLKDEPKEMTEEDETVWKVIRAAIEKHKGGTVRDDLDEDDLNVREFMYHISKFRKSLKRFDVTTEEFLFILRERSDDLENITPSTAPATPSDLTKASNLSTKF